MKEPRTYKIPKGLSWEVAADNQLRKALDTFIVLKEIAAGDRFKNDNATCAILAEQCGISTTTFNRRMRVLREQKLITVSQAKLKGASITMCSWKFLKETFATSVRSHIVELKAGMKVERVMIALHDQEQKKRCEKTLKSKLRRNPEAREAFQNATALTRVDVQKSQFEIFIADGKGFTEADGFNDDMRDALKAFELRHDFTSNYQTMSKLLGYSSRGGYAYMKRRLVAEGYVKLERRCFVFDGFKHSRETMLGKVHFENPRGKHANEKRLVFLAPDNLVRLV